MLCAAKLSDRAEEEEESGVGCCAVDSDGDVLLVPHVSEMPFYASELITDRDLQSSLGARRYVDL